MSERRCQTRGCHNRTGRNRFCSSCRRRAALQAAEARGRYAAITKYDFEPLRPLLDDLIRLCHPDLHQRSPTRLAIANAVTPELVRIRDEY